VEEEDPDLIHLSLGLQALATFKTSSDFKTVGKEESAFKTSGKDGSHAIGPSHSRDWPTTLTELPQGCADATNRQVLVQCVQTGLLFREDHQLRPYQLKLLSWMERMQGGLVCAYMGLGKTLAGLAFCLALKGPCLVVAPDQNIAENVWLKEARLAFENANVALFTPSLSLQSLSQWRVIVTTYDVLACAAEDLGLLVKKPAETKQTRQTTQEKTSRTQNRQHLFSLRFQAVLADESQKISNPATRWSQALRKLQADKRFGLSGTPLPNRLDDVRTQLRFALGDKVATKLADCQLKNYIYFLNYEVARIHMPEKNVEIEMLELDEDTQRLYQAVDHRPAVEPIVRLGIKRAITVAPYIARSLLKKYGYFDGLRDEWLCNREGSAGLLAPKLLRLQAVIQDVCVRQGESLVVFSTYARALKLAAHLVPSNVKFAVVCESMKENDRKKVVASFQARGILLLMLTYQLGSEGHNFQHCRYEVLLNPWWTEVSNIQAQTRTFRTGQQRDVMIRRFLFRNTIEEHVLCVADRKGTEMNNMLNQALQI
jgi:SNF2 family DNA or RNA helicase